MKWLDEIVKRPTRFLEGILAAVIICFAGGSVIHDIVLYNQSQPLGVRLTLTVIYILLAAPTIISYIVKNTKLKYRFRLNGIILLMVAYGFLIILRVTTIGWFPLIWFYPLAFLNILFICYLCAVKEYNDNGG